MKKLLTAFLSAILIELIISPVPILAADTMESSTYEEQLSYDAYEDDFIITDHTITGLSAKPI